MNPRLGSSGAKMGNYIVIIFELLMFMMLCRGYEYKLGDLDAWGIPTAANPQVYAKWSKYHDLKIGDSILFLYPPSQDSVIQVTQESYKSCNLKDPILYMNDGNSLFNITKNGEFYFTSGEDGHCQKNQKLYIAVVDANANAPSYGDAPTALPEYAPSYPTVFGTIPVSASSSSSSSSSSSLPLFFTASALLTLTLILIF